MESYMYSVWILFSLLDFTCGQTPEIHSSPVIIGQSRFEINCSLNVSQIQDVITQQYVTQIRLERASKFSGGASVNTFDHRIDIVSVDFDPSSDAKTVTWLNTYIQTIATVNTGSKLANETFLKMTIPLDLVGCTEEGYYFCTFYGPTFVDNTGVQVDTLMATSYVNVSAPPSESAIIAIAAYTRNSLIVSSNTSSSTIYDMCLSAVSPSDAFRPGTSLVINCTAVVGYPPQPIKWCRKRPRDADFADFEYSTILTQRSDEQLPMSCISTKTSLLLYDVTSVEDDGTELMCQIGDAGGCGSGQIMADIGIGVSSSASQVDLTEFDDCVSSSGAFGSSTVGVQTQLDQNLGIATLIAGIVFLIISTAIMGFVVLMYFKTRKMQKEMVTEKDRQMYQTLSFMRSTDNAKTYEAVNDKSGRPLPNIPTSDNEEVYASAL